MSATQSALERAALIVEPAANDASEIALMRRQLAARIRTLPLEPQMSDLDLDAIERRAAAATPGPWFSEAADHSQERWVSTRETEARIGYRGWQGLAAANGCEDDPVAGALVARCNAAFIAHARADVPALIAEVRRLRAALAEMQEPATAAGSSR